MLPTASGSEVHGVWPVDQHLYHAHIVRRGSTQHMPDFLPLMFTPERFLS